MINEYLRDKYQYNGIIMTDDFKMRAISFRYGYMRAAVKAFDAGADIIMIGTSYHTVIKVIKKIEKNVKSKKLNIEKIDKSVNRIMNLKTKYAITDEPVNGCNIEKINKLINCINEKI